MPGIRISLLRPKQCLNNIKLERSSKLKAAITDLKPALVWEHFYQLSQIPRCSGNEEAAGKYIISVAARNNLPYKKDKSGNIIVSKPASSGMEQYPSIVLQGHTDMVGEKNKNSAHDFLKDPINLLRDDEWIRADGTTLGSDNGIGVAYALAVMEDKSLQHPAMEFLFTVDEETGLTGANALKPDFVRSRILLNLDSEEEGAFYIGCAGGKHTILRKKITWKKPKNGWKSYKISVGGLIGGHSGLNIHQGLGNSIKLLSRFLYNLGEKLDFALSAVNGGSKHNAIPRDAEALLCIPPAKTRTLQNFVKEMDAVFKNELQTIDGAVYVNIEPVQKIKVVFSPELQRNLVNLLYAMPHGVISMSQAIAGLVETSTNMAIVQTKEKQLELTTSQRSSVASAILDIADKVKALGELATFDVEQGGGYPAWQPNPNSQLLKSAIRVYEKINGSKPEVKAIHAGLECGIIGEKYTGMDMLSFGPTIMGAHSPDERVHIPAVEKTWNFLLELLKTA
jgi:dipeptidase D